MPRGNTCIASPAAPADELRATWVGHSTFLLQIGGRNLLTDPHWSERASPVQFLGPRRFAPAAVDFDALPPVHGVLISHDHYDHLDDGTVRRLHDRFGEALTWFTPLGYRAWMAKRGIHATAELDWGESATLGPLRLRCHPAQHWSSRGHLDRMRRLWCSWSVYGEGRAVYFGGDSGWFPGYPGIRDAAGPFDLVLMPIGAYDPRWFMRTSHMNPEEAVQAFGELGGTGELSGMHWGTFRLTDEDPLEPPERCREAWKRAEYPPERLWIPRLGETRIVPPR